MKKKLVREIKEMLHKALDILENGNDNTRDNIEYIYIFGYLSSLVIKKAILEGKNVEYFRQGEYNILQISDGLDLDGEEIDYLPNNLTIFGDLNLINSQIDKLPDNLTIHGDIYVENKKITENCENFFINGKIIVLK